MGAQEKIAEIMLDHSITELFYSFAKNGGSLNYCVECIRNDFEKAGYRKLPEGEPPLLNGEDINGSPELTRTYIEYFKKYSYTKANRAIQRDSDIKWMREKER